MSAKLVAQFKAARRVSTPLIVVRTPDPSATLDALTHAVIGNGGAKPQGETDEARDAVLKGSALPLLRWNIVQGLLALSAGGAKALKAAGIDDPSLQTNLVEVLDRAMRLPKEAVLFVENAHRYLDDNLSRTPEVAAVVQAVWNLRDPFKTNFRTCVLLCPDVALPAELAQDTLVLDEPYPGAEELADIVRAVHEQADFTPPDEALVARAVDALRGVAAYPAEQATAMCLQKDGSLDVRGLWGKKEQIINGTPGLTHSREDGGFAGLGGLENAKRILADIFGGRERPCVIVLLDEMEKQFAGATGSDLSGTAQMQMGKVLSYMDGTGGRKIPGLVFLGPPGSGKTALARAAAGEFGVPLVVWDLGDSKGGLVGLSEERTRNALRVIDAVGDGRMLFVGTCNKSVALPPEFRRRFFLGSVYFDLPNEGEKDSIHKVYEAKYALADPRPDDTDWTGGEIAACAYKAWNFRKPRAVTALTTSPVAKAMGSQLMVLRQEAEQAGYISASYEGPYRASGPAATPTLPVRARGIRKEG